jgi:hypothetical protein
MVQKKTKTKTCFFPVLFIFTVMPNLTQQKQHISNTVVHQLNSKLRAVSARDLA